jgi:hypothetical protein
MFCYYFNTHLGKQHVGELLLEDLKHWDTAVCFKMIFLKQNSSEVVRKCKYWLNYKCREFNLVVKWNFDYGADYIFLGWS